MLFQDPFLGVFKNLASLWDFINKQKVEILNVLKKYCSAQNSAFLYQFGLGLRAHLFFLDIAQRFFFLNF